MGWLLRSQKVNFFPQHWSSTLFTMLFHLFISMSYYDFIQDIFICLKVRDKFFFSWVAIMLFPRILPQPLVLTNETNSGLAENVSSLASKPQFAYNVNLTEL